MFRKTVPQLDLAPERRSNKKFKRQAASGKRQAVAGEDRREITAGSYLTKNITTREKLFF